MGSLLGFTVAGLPLLSVYIQTLFLGFWAWLLWAAVSRPRRAAGLFSTPAPWVAIGVAALYFFLHRHDLSGAYTYEVSDLAAASAAAAAGDLTPLLQRGSVIPFFFGVLIYVAGPQGLTALLCLFIGLFYALWERILASALGFKQPAAALLALLAAAAQLKLRYLFSAYFIFALFFSALFLYNLLLLLKDGDKEQSLLRLLQPAALILLASLFRQESVTLFAVYLTGLFFVGRPARRKGAAVLAAAAVLYLPFLYRDWTREDHQVLRPLWVQVHAERFYDARPGDLPRELFVKNQLLANAAYAVRTGRLFGTLDKEQYLAAVKEVLFVPQPSLRNVWYNLKYRSGFFRLATAAWALCGLAALVWRRRLGGDAKYLAALAAYSLGFFFIFHLANMAIEIWVSYCHLLPAYLAFCAVAARRLREGAGA